MEYSINKIEELYFDNSIFDKIIDCTYILLCCGSKPKRLESVLKNIKLLHPTKKVKLIFNNGFSQCKKSKTVNHNLINMQLFIFNDSIKNGYNRILYLEDDFELKQEIDKKDVDNIIEFINTENPDVYGLGNFSFPKINYILSKHQKVIYNFLGCAHAMVYTKNYMKKSIEFINNNKTPENLSIDFIPSYINNIEAYRYYKPIIYQKFPITENQTNGWKNQMGNFLSKLAIFFVQFLQLNISLEPGYTILYVFPYLIYILLFITIFMICFKKYNQKVNHQV
jgi:hypothetical protein